MFLIFPVYKFNIYTRYRPLLVKAKISSLIKKEAVHKKEKVKFRFAGEDWGTEEFTGVVEEKFFKLKRYQYFSRDAKVIVYRGTVIPTENGSIVHLTFRFDYSTMIMLGFVSIIPVFAVLANYLVNSSQPLTTSLLGFIFAMFFYSIFMVGFNYRSKKVRELLEKKLK